jgi:hypothetical protein
VVVGDSNSKVSGNGGGADGARLAEGRTGVWSSSSLASRSDEEVRPEGAQAGGASGDGAAHDLLHVLDK